MFDKLKARLEKLEETNEDYRKVRQHVVKYKHVYVGIPVAFGAGYLLKGKASPDVVQTFANSKNNVAVAVNKSKNVDVVVQYVKSRNYVANPVMCLETGEKWASQIEAAVAKNVNPALLSQHLNDKLEHANGLHFVRV